MGQLVENLTNQKHIMSYEFRESGLLDALDVFLTYSPSQAKVVIERKKALAKGEELKSSEEMQINTMNSGLGGEGKKISKKEARCFLQRLKVFTHLMLNKIGDQRPLEVLVHLC